MSLLGTRIKAVRGRRSQAEFGALLNADRTTVGSWELGRHEPDIETLMKIASSANVSLDWLTGYSKFHSLEEERRYCDSSWHEIIDLSTEHKITPKRLKALILAGLDLSARS